MSDRPAHEPTEIKITPEMVDAAAEVLWSHPLLDISESEAAELAQEMLARSWPLFCEKIRVAAPPTH